MANVNIIQKQGDTLSLLYDDGTRKFAYPTGQSAWIISGGSGGEPEPSEERFVFPFPFADVTSEFGTRNGRLHAGIDFGKGTAVNGADVKASSAGRVQLVSNSHGGYGSTVILDHGDGLCTLYAHMIFNSFTVGVGDMVTQNQKLGSVGNTGASYGAHLHFETHEGGYRWNASARDPRLFIPKYNGQ